jgi:hypothetical protein
MVSMGNGTSLRWVCHFVVCQVNTLKNPLVISQMRPSLVLVSMRCDISFLEAIQSTLTRWSSFSTASSSYGDCESGTKSSRQEQISTLILKNAREFRTEGGKEWLIKLKHLVTTDGGDTEMSYAGKHRQDEEMERLEGTWKIGALINSERAPLSVR